MPQSVSHVLMPGRSGASYQSAGAQPVFAAPVRWVLRVLAWLAFGIATYLAWKAVTQTSVAGCGVGDLVDCDVVLTSSWSKWLGIPVAVAGLGCYATLATLSIFLGVRDSEMNRWISTAFIALSVIAAGASLWFIGVQVIAIGNICKFCLATDIFGIVLGIVATAFGARSFFANRGAASASSSQAGWMALRPAAPTGSRTAPAMARPISSSPALGVALGASLPLLVVLIGGQLLFATKTYEVQKVALADPIKMVDSTTDDTNETSPTATTRTAMRPTDGEPSQNDEPLEPPTEKTPGEALTEPSKDTTPSIDNSPKAPPAPPLEPLKPRRAMTFLEGKLTLDVYQHAIIGSPDAPYIVVEMISYDCAHCRKMHATMKDALKRYGNQVAILVMFVPLEKDCNKLVTDPAASHRGACETARMAIALAKMNQSAFLRFHDFVMTGKDKPPAIERIIPKAYGLVDRDRLRALIRSPEVKRQIESYIDLYEQLQKKNRGKGFGLPVQILGDHIVTGDVEKTEDVYKNWEQYLGVKPK